MPLSIDELDGKAEVTADLLVSAIRDGKLADGICDSYTEICNTVLKKFNVTPKKIGSDEKNRLFFELVCFPAFLIMGTMAEKQITKPRLLVMREPDVEGIRRYNDRLSEKLISHLKEAGATDVREITVLRMDPKMEFGQGELLDFDRRIADYLRLATTLEAAERFPMYIAFAVDPERYVELKVLGAQYLKPISLLADAIVKDVFGATTNK